MKISHLPVPSVYDSDFDAKEILERYDAYIVALAYKSVPRNVVLAERLSDAADELAQSVRIKLWCMVKKRSIQNPKAYIWRIVRNEAVNIVRKYKSPSSLSINEEEELYQSTPLVELSEGMRDPLDKVEQEEVIADYVRRIVEAVLRLPLPPRQQYAVICSLKDHINDVFLVIYILRNNVMNVGGIHWLEEKDELQNLQASLSVARKKLWIEGKKRNFDLLNTKDKRRYKGKLILSKCGNDRYSHADRVHCRSCDRRSVSMPTHPKSASFSLYDVRGSPKGGKCGLEHVAMKVSRQHHSRGR
jgi:DNA-directed RNA polymerase specialized sigma24 family protein